MSAEIVMRELNLAVKLRDYARGQVALSSEGLRLLLLDASEALEIAARARMRDDRAAASVPK